MSTINDLSRSVSSVFISVNIAYMNIELIGNLITLFLVCLITVGGYVAMGYCNKVDKELEDDETFGW